MDIKSKNKLKLSIIFILVFCIAAGVTAALVSRSIIRSIENNADLSEEQVLTDNFTEVIDDSAYLLYYSMCLNADSTRSPEDVFFPASSHSYDEERMTQTLAGWQNDFLYFMKKVFYYMRSSEEAEAAYQQTNLKSNQVIQAIQRFMKEGKSETSLDKTYEAYFCLKYLPDGSIVFYNGKGSLGDRIFSTLQTLNNTDKMMYYYSGTRSADKLNPPRNMEIFYAFPTLDLKELGIGYSGNLSYFEVSGGGRLYLGIFVASILFAVFLALFCGNGCLMTTGFVTRAPEWSLAGFILCAFLSHPLFLLSSDLGFSEWYDVLSVAAAWAGNALLIVWSSLLLIPGFRKELRGDLIQRSITVKSFKLLKKLWLRFAGWMEAVFIRSYRKLLPVVFILLTIYSFLNSRDSGPLILYLCLLAGLYYVLSRALKKSFRGYDAMLQLMDQMDQGNLDVSMNEDLGVFEPMKEKTLRIRDGLQKALEEEHKSQNMRTELITNVSHDLRTPLTAIITYIDILKKADLPEDERIRCLEVLDMKSARLKTLIDDLFEMSKASSDNITIELEAMDFVKFVRQYQVESEDRLEASGLDFRFELPERELPVLLDGQRTYRIFENLTSNAVKYSAAGSRVYVKVEQAGRYAKFSMKNVSATELNFDSNEITERFIRGDLARSSEGSGLGLAIAKSFTELQGGTFRIEIDGDLFKAIILWPLAGGTETSC